VNNVDDEDALICLTAVAACLLRAAQNIQKLGPISKVMQMMPGFSQSAMVGHDEKETQARFKCTMCIMDSMTDDGAHARHAVLYCTVLSVCCVWHT